jgi:hypothetical protein
MVAIPSDDIQSDELLDLRFLLLALLRFRCTRLFPQSPEEPPQYVKKSHDLFSINNTRRPESEFLFLEPAGLR